MLPIVVVMLPNTVAMLPAMVVVSLIFSHRKVEEPVVPCVRLVRLTTCNICLGKVEETVLPCMGLVIVKAAGLSCRVSRREVHRKNILKGDEGLLTPGVCNVI